MAEFIDPSREAFGAFRANRRETPVHMLNLVRLREVAAYPPDHEMVEKGLTGAEAYRSYGAESAPIFSGLGGRIVYRAEFEQTLIGPDVEHWDLVFIAEYPSSDAFVAMVKDPDYRKAVVHRQAAVADSRLIRLQPGAAGGVFG